MDNNILLQGDCLDLMKNIPDKSIDMVLCDLPYQITKCKWDIVIPFEPLWAQYKRVIKSNGAIVLTASQPFTSALVMSNPNMFRYCWVWDKKLSTQVLNCNKMPLKRHEDICIFYNNLPTYNPFMRKGMPRLKGKVSRSETNATVNHREDLEQYVSDEYYPTSILEISNANLRGRIHPTQKPVALFEYLIKTYTRVGDTVLDNCSGSATTAIACINTERNYICMEKDIDIFNTGKDRVEKYLKQTIQPTLGEM